MSSMACNGVRSEADGATNGATDGPFFRLPNEFAGDFVEGSLPDGCIIFHSLAGILPGILVHATLRAGNQTPQINPACYRYPGPLGHKPSKTISAVTKPGFQ